MCEGQDEGERENVSLIDETNGFENQTKCRRKEDEEEKRSFVSHFIVLWMNLIDE